MQIQKSPGSEPRQRNDGVLSKNTLPEHCPNVKENALDELFAVMADHGLDPGDIVPDGELHRFSSNGRTSDKAGYYSCFDHGDGVYGAFFGDWRTGGESVSWFSKSFQGLSPQRQSEVLAQFEVIREHNEGKRQATYESASVKAQRLWDQAKPAATDHPYLMKKQIQPHGIRQDSNGWLVVPVLDHEGKVQSIQHIGPDGQKRFMSGGKISGGCYVIQGTVPGLIIAEGYATATSLCEATGQTVACAFNCGNLLPVARKLRELNPRENITIAGDDDQWTAGNPGRAKAERAAREIGATAVFPSFKDVSTKPTDFNDMAVLEGVEAVKQAIEGNGVPGIFQGDFSRYSLRSLGFLDQEPEPLTWVLDNILLTGNVGFLVGAPGTGKTFLSLILGMTVCSGFSPLEGLESGLPRGQKVIIVTAEDDGRVLHRRIRRIAREMFSFNDEQFLDNLFVVSAQGNDVRLLQDVGGVASSSMAFADLLAMVQAVKPALVILDPLSRLFAGSENDNTRGTLFSSLLEQIAQKTGAAVLCCHHTNKGSAKDSQKKFNLDLALSPDVARGASSFLGACRAMITMTSLPEKTACELIKDTESGRQYLAFQAAKVSAGPRGDVRFMYRDEYGILHSTNGATVEPDEDLEKSMQNAIRQEVQEHERALTVKRIKETLTPKLKARGIKTTKACVENCTEMMVLNGQLFDVWLRNGSGRKTRYLTTEEESNTILKNVCEVAGEVAGEVARSGKKSSAPLPLPTVEPFREVASNSATSNPAPSGTHVTREVAAGRILSPKGEMAALHSATSPLAIDEEIF